MKTTAQPAEISSDYMYEKLWLAAKVIESTMEGIFITDAEGVIEVVNPAFTNLTGLTWKEAITRHPELMASSEKEPTLDKAFWKHIGKQGNWQGELWLKHKDGHSFPSMVSVNALSPDPQNGQPTQFVVLFNDISEHKLAEQQIEQMAYFDPLTRLPNRSFLLQQLSQEIQKAERSKQMTGLLLLDLDRFKMINDTLGHEVGDQVLIQVGNRLRQCFSEDTLLARIGDDEFTLVLPQLETVEQASQVAEDIFNCLEAPFFHNDQELHITTSIGIGLYPEDGRDSLTLLKHAEVALYRAKKQGRNIYKFYTSTFNAKALERLVMENRLRHALERDEFVVFYQPQVHLESGEIRSAEALLRWDHPDIGMIPPVEFIPIAEETGLLPMIDNWVLKTACLQGKIWHDSGHPIHVAVNLSSQQLKQLNFAGRVDQTLKETGFSPTFLKLEMTESILIENPELTISTLREIRNLGVEIAIDDFGTGYSSLSHLKRLPISTLKIDQSFIRDCIRNIDDAAIITAIVTMSHSLGLEVVAEGVENKEQYEFLYSLQCDQIQGYIFSPPVGLEDFNKLLSRGKPQHRIMEKRGRARMRHN